jgi:hypothetical protein
MSQNSLWSPAKGKARKVLTGTPRIQGSPKTTVPASMSKSVRSDCGGWGRGLGNNVSNTMRGVNAAPDAMAAEIDADTEGTARRQRHYAKLRSTDAFKMQRAAAKRARKAARFSRNDADDDRDVAPRSIDLDAYLRIMGTGAKATRKYAPDQSEQLIIRLRSMR